MRISPDWRRLGAGFLTLWLLLSPSGLVGAAIHPAASIYAGRDLVIQKGALQIRGVSIGLNSETVPFSPKTAVTNCPATRAKWRYTNATALRANEYAMLHANRN